MIQISLFGIPRIAVEEQPIAFSRRKSLAVLAYLALHPGPQLRERIAGIFWGDTADENARRSLRVILADLRKALGEEAISGDRDTLALNSDLAAELDTERFARLLRKPAPPPNAHLEAAVALYRGELLTGMDDEWILPLRQQFHAQWLHAALLRIERHRAEGDYAAAIQTARALLGREPANENAHQHLVFCLAANGERAAALQQVESCRAALRQHLDAEPSAETQALAASIQKRPVETPAARLDNLPRPFTSFIGREDELNEVETLLTAARLVTLCGAGGSGKTRLAIQVADEVAHAYPGGVWWVDFSVLQEPGLIVQSIARTLGVREQGSAPLLDLIARQVGRQTLLLVLDNCEHLLAETGQAAAHLLAHCPELKILATSRDPLDLTGEQAWQTPPLPLPAPGQAFKTLRRNEAVRLFAERARAGSGFQLSEINAAQVAQVCRRLNGIPLALELAAAQLGPLTLAELAGQLSQTLDWSQAEGQERHATLRAALRWSYDLLSPPQQARFRRLGACPAAGGYSQPDASVLPANGAGITPLPVSGRMIVRQVLESLARKALIQAQHGADGLRYILLDTLREFAREQCRQAEELGAVAAGHAVFFFDLLKAGFVEIYSETEGALLDRLERDLPNLRLAWEWQTGAAGWEVAVEAIGCQSRLWLMRGHYDEARRAFSRLLEHPQAPAAARAELLNSLGLTEWQSGRRPAAQNYFTQAPDLYLALGLRKSAAMISVNLGGLLVDEETDPAAAEMRLRAGLAWAQETGHLRAQAIGLNNLATLVTDQGDLPQARRLLEESLQLRRTLGDRRGVGVTLNNLGDVEAEEGHLERAYAFYAESFAIRARLGDRRGALIPALNLARIFCLEEAWQKAVGILGFAAQAQADMGIQLALDARRAEEECGANARSALGEVAFAAAYQRGQKLTFEAALELAARR